jgi:hypothetical protein
LIYINSQPQLRTYIWFVFSPNWGRLELSIRNTRRRFEAASALTASSIALSRFAAARTSEVGETADLLLVQSSKGPRFDKATGKPDNTSERPS